ncbi:hypothetical protein SAMN06269185_1177 [Natronoarchaeum philippinense]|uniref:Uncharacterized protein n=1 Tax=Natronoarchaeum philippinense TaxID=558529 RepID=A0A285NBZ3_NATPI|nr:hypothetical protein [Natronoarchaeum philippinense]SNZ06457.1 hypothetical protein SAMN06269185_1177 [Natronoarchaeum philippinense]
MTVDDLLREAEREQRQQLEQEAMKATALRTQLPHIVQETVAQVLEEADDLEHARELAGLEPEGDLEK